MTVGICVSVTNYFESEIVSKFDYNFKSMYDSS